MKRFGCLAIGLLTMALSGCAGSPVPVTDEMINEAGEVVKITTRYVADASVAKEEAVHKTLQARDRAIVQDGKNSGMAMTWTTVEETISYPGQPPITMKRAMPVISFKERGRFEQKLPTEPSVHPGWKTAENIVGGVVRGTIIGMGITEGAGVIKAAIGAGGTKNSITAETATVTDNRVDISNSGANSQVSANSGAAGSSPTGTTSSTVNPAHWADCTTVSGGPASIDEINACMQRDYGYNTSVVDGQIYLDGRPIGM